VKQATINLGFLLLPYFAVAGGFLLLTPKSH